MTKLKYLNNNWNINLINILKLSYCFSANDLVVKIVKKNLIILKILKRFNYISDYKFLTKDIIIIYLYYKNNKKLWNNLKLYYKASHFLYLDIYTIRRFYKNEYKKLIFIHTGKGIITHIDAFKKNIGGKLYFILY